MLKYFCITNCLCPQLNGAAQTIAPGLIGVDYDDLTDDMKTPSCWSDVSSIIVITVRQLIIAVITCYATLT